MATLLFTGIRHPGLLTLWNKGSEKLQWKVFCAAVSPQLDPKLLRELPPHLMIPAATLAYLCHVSKIIGTKLWHPLLSLHDIQEWPDIKMIMSV
jgi:hypothetical protein